MIEVDEEKVYIKLVTGFRLLIIGLSCSFMYTNSDLIKGNYNYKLF